MCLNIFYQYPWFVKNIGHWAGKVYLFSQPEIWDFLPNVSFCFVLMFVTKSGTKVMLKLAPVINVAHFIAVRFHDATLAAE